MVYFLLQDYCLRAPIRVAEISTYLLIALDKILEFAIIYLLNLKRILYESASF